MSDEKAGYELIEHTADVAVKAYGKDLSELFANAALGMFNVMTDTSTVKSVGEYTVEVESADLEGLLVDWLSELLYLFDTQEVFLREFDVTIDGNKLTASVRGEKLDRERHPLKSDVKAATYHMLEINEEEGYVIVLLDI
ncbi:MAG: archease [Thermoplasmata archaeon]|nr:archease [Thermoplasmata archaeon]